jgi:hypothetical protein
MSQHLSSRSQGSVPEWTLLVAAPVLRTSMRRCRLRSAAAVVTGVSGQRRRFPRLRTEVDQAAATPLFDGKHGLMSFHAASLQGPAVPQRVRTVLAGR